MIFDRLSDLDLSSYLCSHICHDVISPVGAIVNGMELLHDEVDEQMRCLALDLVRQSALNASAKLQFARLAFGSAETAGSAMPLDDAKSIVANFMSGGKVELNWSLSNDIVAKHKIKLLLNLILIALQAIPHGGSLYVSMGGDVSAPEFILKAQGQHVRIPQDAVNLLTDTKGKASSVDVRTIQAYYTALIAEQCLFTINCDLSEDVFTVVAGSCLAN